MQQVRGKDRRFLEAPGQLLPAARAALLWIALVTGVVGVVFGQAGENSGRPLDGAATQVAVRGWAPNRIVTSGAVTHEQPMEGWFTTSAGAAHATLEVLLSTEDADWADAARPSVVLTLGVDGQPSGDLVVTGRERPFRELIGPIGEGRHRWTLRWHKTASPQPRGKVTVREVRITPDRSGLAAHAPRIFGRLAADKQRAVMATSDVPLLLLGRATGEDFEYTAVFSNEDGGTGLLPSLLMRQYGRTSDIERVCRVQGSRCEFQGANHKTREYGGSLEGAHPLLRVATDNNNFTDAIGDASRGLRFSLAPQPFPEQGPRGRVLDREGWISAIANAEMQREVTELMGFIGKRKIESPGDAATLALSDLRNYIGIEAHVDAAKEVAWRVGARAAGQWYWSDHGVARERERGSGWPRTGVELPPRAVADAVCVECCGEGTTLTVTEFRAWAFDAAAMPRPDGTRMREAVAVRSGTPFIRVFKP